MRRSFRKFYTVKKSAERGVPKSQNKGAKILFREAIRFPKVFIKPFKGSHIENLLVSCLSVSI